MEKGNSVLLEEEDVIEAMKKIGTYLDISPSDFKKLYGIIQGQIKEKFLYKLKAKDLMNPKVIFLFPEENLKNAILKLAEAEISGAPVIDKEKVVGVLSEKDILKALGIIKSPCLLSLLVSFFDTDRFVLFDKIKNLKVKDIMSTPSLTVQTDDPIIKVINLMKIKKINRVPVIDKKEKLVGIITRADLLKHPYFIEELE